MSLKETLHEDFNLNLSFGVHLGSGVEGTTGSNFKIDISYFSPNINFARTLENLTKTYSVNLILSNDIVYYMSDDARAYTRPIDAVLKSDKSVESKNIFNKEIYTIDMDLKCLQPSKETKAIGDEKITDKLLKVAVL